MLISSVSHYITSVITFIKVSLLSPARFWLWKQICLCGFTDLISPLTHSPTCEKHFWTAYSLLLTAISLVPFAYFLTVMAPPGSAVTGLWPHLQSYPKSPHGTASLLSLYTKLILTQRGGKTPEGSDKRNNSFFVALNIGNRGFFSADAMRLHVWNGLSNEDEVLMIMWWTLASAALFGLWVGT